jgi:glutathione S-transferase
MLTLFFAPGSSSMAPHIALHEIGAPFESRPVSFAKDEQHARSFLALNPEGKVPTMVTDSGAVITEVAACLFYLAKKFPEAKLLPAGLDAEAQAVSWMSFAAATLHGARGRGAEIGRAAWQVAEKKLAGRDWALGSYSIADIHLFRVYWRFRPLLGMSASDMPALDAHYARMMARPAVKRTIEIEAAIGYESPR